MSKIISISLHQEVAERIQQRILSQDFKPGDRLDEQMLADEFGISRTPLREALKVLQSEGLVTIVPRRGCFVARLSDRDLDDIYAIVALFESRCAGVVALNANDDDLKRLQRLHERMEQAAISRDLKRYSDANLAVHEALLEIGGNRWQKRIVQNLRRLLKLSYKLTIGLPGRLEESLAEHRALLSALLAHDSALAERVMNDHMKQQRIARDRQEHKGAVHVATT